MSDGSAESADRIAALVTPDRALARRVLAALARWNVPVDNSGGDALADTRAGIFARLAAELALQGCEPVTLLALLRHPLCRLGGTNSRICRRWRCWNARSCAARGRGPAPTDSLHALETLRKTREKLHRSDPRRADRCAISTSQRRWPRG